MGGGGGGGICKPKKDMFFIQISQTIYLLNFGEICLTALHIIFPALPDSILRVIDAK